MQYAAVRVALPDASGKQAAKGMSGVLQSTLQSVLQSVLQCVLQSSVCRTTVYVALLDASGNHASKDVLERSAGL